jgi:FkbM family methyltransferase
MVIDLISLGPVELVKRAVKWSLFAVFCRRSLPRYYSTWSRIMYELARRRLYEPAELSFLERCVPTGGAALDVGASFGVYTTRLAEQVGSSGRVLAFEPLPGVFESLVNSVSSYPQVRCFKQGISDRAASAAEFKLPLLFGEIPEPALASISEDTPQGFRIEHIELITLDSLMNQLERLDFIKIDTEGYELNCLQGARTLLNTYRPLVQFAESTPVVRVHLFQRFAEDVDYVVCILTRNGYLNKLQNAHRIDEMRSFYLVPFERMHEFERPTKLQNGRNSTRYAT